MGSLKRAAKAVFRWYRSLYDLLTVLFVLFLLALTTGDELNNGLGKVLAWSSRQVPVVRLVIALGVLHSIVGLVRLSAKLTMEPLEPVLEKRLMPFLVPIVRLFNRSEAAREELAQVEYRYRPPQR